MDTDTQMLPFVKASYWFFDPEIDFPPKNIDSTLFTHLFCSYAQINSHTNEVIFTSTNQSQFSTFTQAVQIENKNVQTLLSIGGKNADTTTFASMASNIVTRKTFIDSSISIARLNGFYGLDLAWQYPNNIVEMANFKKLIEEWRVAIDDESNKTYQLPLLLTASVYYSPVYYSVKYPVQAIIDNLDFVNILSYDFYGPGWSLVTGPTAALYDHTNPTGQSGESGLSQWIEAKLLEKKAVFGFSHCGWAWTLEDPKKYGYGAPTDGPAETPDGSMNYDMIKNYIVNSGAATLYDATVIGYNCCAETTWIGYDDNQSVVFKVKYAKQKGLLGYFSWHVGADSQLGLSRAASLAWDTTDTIIGK